MAPTKPLPALALARRTDPSSLGFATTAEIEPLNDALGQDRAIEAIRFGIGMRQEGYNMFALGPTGCGVKGDPEAPPGAHEKFPRKYPSAIDT